MMDRLLVTLLNLTVVTLITAVAAASLILGYSGLLLLLGAHFVGGSAYMTAATGFALGALVLVRNRNDLVDR